LKNSIKLSQQDLIGESNSERDNRTEREAGESAEGTEEIKTNRDEDRGEDQVTPDRVARVGLSWTKIRVNANFVIARARAIGAGGCAVGEGVSAMGARLHALLNMKLRTGDTSGTT
jgi:hypothetical protein